MQTVRPVPVATRRPESTTGPQVEVLNGSGIPGVTDSEEVVLRRVRQLALLLDDQFTLPGTNFRFGIDALLGLIPGIGDFAGVVLSASIIAAARHLGAPKWVLTKMVANVALDAAGGLVPIVGDLFDASFKANRKNVALLERHLLDRRISKK